MTIDTNFDSERFFNALIENAAKTRSYLDQILPSACQNTTAEAMRYSVMNGGKCLRSFLVMESCKLFNLPETSGLQAAAAIECIHSYSLVHDDLPSMDNDDFRRGKQTVHKKWNEAIAILAGDGLQTFAFQTLANSKTHLNANRRLLLISSLAEAAGIHGMVGGQTLDIEAEKSQKDLSIESIKKLQELKTGALIVWSALVGPRLAKKSIKPLTTYAEALGLAFQIKDDILDATGDPNILGKKTKKDASAGKATFVSSLGLDEANAKAKRLVEKACDSLETYSADTFFLEQAAKFSIERNY